jgi:hypothetical protein
MSRPYHQIEPADAFFGVSPSCREGSDQDVRTDGSWHPRTIAIRRTRSPARRPARTMPSAALPPIGHQASGTASSAETPAHRDRLCIRKWPALHASARAPLTAMSATQDGVRSDDRCGDAARVLCDNTPASRRLTGSRPSSPRTWSRGSSGWLGRSKAAATRKTPSRCQRRSRGGTPRRKTVIRTRLPPRSGGTPVLGKHSLRTLAF